MFTQMQLDKEDDKVYIYDKEELDSDSLSITEDKLQTIIEGGSSVTSFGPSILEEQTSKKG
jgi:hypothetical protein